MTKLATQILNLTVENLILLIEELQEEGVLLGIRVGPRPTPPEEKRVEVQVKPTELQVGPKEGSL